MEEQKRQLTYNSQVAVVAERLLAGLVRNTAVWNPVVNQLWTEWRAGSSQPLQSDINTAMWQWKVSSSYQWQRKGAHIKVSACAGCLKERSKQRLRDTRVLTIRDSQVAVGVLNKGKSSSWELNALCLRVGSQMTACGFLPLFGWTPSKKNPADGPSQWPRRA